jgi:two-component system phosphate regulon sensor histidine kinase PhoR
VPTVSRRAFRISGTPVLAVWSVEPDELRAVVAGPDYFEALLTSAVPEGFVGALTDSEGVILRGPAVLQGFAEVRSASAVGLPWTLHLTTASGAELRPRNRRLLLSLVFGTVALVTMAGGYFIFRAIGHERRVGRMQSEFVATVSHEFRTPLSSMSHIAQLLDSGRLSTDDARRRSYGVLVRETERLRQLVEGLLDFGRFERATAFTFERLDLAAVVRSTVHEFQGRVASDGYAVELSCPPGEAIALADREAFVRALSNLLENAVKYSPDCRTLWVDVVVDSHVRIAVRDEGLGIPRDEQAQIFERFVRGRAAGQRRIRGTGIGLATVSHIVQAHGGTIRLQSEPGRGSCFTLEFQTYRSSA